MKSLLNANIKVKYHLKNEANFITDYRYFSLSSTQKIALGEKFRQETPSLRIIRNKDDVDSMSRQFNELFENAKELKLDTLNN